MTKAIDGGRLRELRHRKNLSQQELARRAKLTKGSLHRLEAGKQPGSRRRTLEGLAEALEVEPGVLTGELALPEADIFGQPKSQINFRIDDAVRNAFWLASRCYRIPITRIVELAPFLLVCAAEGSLARRRTKLAERDAYLDRGDALRSAFPHLPNDIVPFSVEEGGFWEEERSIEAHDILARDLPDYIFQFKRRVGRVLDGVSGYDREQDNPFVLFLQESGPADRNVASISRVTASVTDFEVRRGDVLELCCGDTSLADSVIRGLAPLYKMPSHLLENGAAEDRVAWLRERCEEYRARMPDLLAMLDDPLPPEAAS